MADYTHRWTATIAGTVLDILEGSLTLDENWAPYIQGSITIPTTIGIDPDPHAGARVLLTLAATPVVAIDLALPVTRSFDLGVREQTIDQFAGTTVLTLASDEALLQDYIQFGSGVSASGDIWNVVAVAIGLALPTATVVDDAFPFNVPVEVSMSNQTIWDVITPWVRQAGDRVWCDAGRSFYVSTALDDIAGIPLVLDYLRNLTGATDARSREGDWANGIGVKYGADGLTAYNTPAGYSKGLLYDEPDLSMDAAFLEVSTRLARQQRISTLTLTGISDYTAEPLAPLFVTLPDGIERSGGISAVTFNFPADEMTIRPRDLVTP